MKKRNKVFMIVVLLLICVGGVTYQFTSNNVFEKNQKKIVVDDHSFANIEILTNNATVEIVPTKSSQTTVEYSGKTKSKSKFIFKADVKGDTLSILFKEKRRNFFSFGFSSVDLTLTVNVPERQYAKILAETDNGRINVEKMQANEFVLETDNGAVNLKNIEAASVNVKTDNGKIILDDVEGKIIARTDNGQITMNTDHLDRSIELTTDNGRIEIRTEKEPANAIIDAKTDNGRVEVFGHENKHSTFGKGEHLIKLRTDNGRITVTK